MYYEAAHEIAGSAEGVDSSLSVQEELRLQDSAFPTREKGAVAPARSCQTSSRTGVPGQAASSCACLPSADPAGEPECKTEVSSEPGAKVCRDVVLA